MVLKMEHFTRTPVIITATFHCYLERNNGIFISAAFKKYIKKGLSLNYSLKNILSEAASVTLPMSFFSFSAYSDSPHPGLSPLFWGLACSEKSEKSKSYKPHLCSSHQKTCPFPQQARTHAEDSWMLLV